jgi:hypothetical protein
MSERGGMRPIFFSVLAAWALVGCEPVTTSSNGASSVAITGERRADAPATMSDSWPSESNADEQTYIRDKIKVYDIDGRFFDSILDGRVPGIRFKIKNIGARTLREVRVRLLFKDESGTVIYENDYSPVLAGALYDSDPPLRPNYVWQNDRNQFYSPSGIPSEVDPRKTEVRVIDIEFADAEAS